MKKTILYLIFSTVLLCSFSVKTYSQSVKDFYNVAMAEFNNGNYKSSLNNLDKVINILGSSNARIQYYKSKCYYQLKEYHKCKQEIEKYRKTGNGKASWNREMNLIYNKANDAINKQKQLLAAEEYKKKQEVERRKKEEYENSPEKKPNRWLITAIKNNDLEFLKELVSYGADIHVGLKPYINSDKTYSLLYLAVNEVNSYNDYGRTNFNIETNYKIIKYLLENGADPNKEFNCMGSPLERAITNQEKGEFYYKRIKLLLTNGAKYIHSDYYWIPFGITAINYKIDSNLLQIYEMIITSGLENINIHLKTLVHIHKDSYYKTDYLLLAKLLLENGANPNYKTKYKGKYMSLIKMAKKKKKNDLVELMKQYK